MAKILYYRDKCIGCNACVEFAPQFWRISEEDGKSDLIESRNVKGVFVRSVEIVDIEEVKRTSSNCPVNIIKIA